MTNLSSHMRMVLSLRDTLPTNGSLQVALLVTPPKPEGDSGRELTAPGYERRAVTFDMSQPTASKTHNAEPVEWAFGGIWPATHIALIDADDRTIAYGTLEGPTPFSNGIRMGRGRIEVRR